MAKVGAQRAAELTGRSKSTIQRAMNNGKLSYEVDPNQRRVIDVAELDRAFGLLPQDSGRKTSDTIEVELEKASQMLETERLKMRIKMLEEQLDSTREILTDIKEQRDQWQKQAQQVLLTSQYSQKQAEELKEEIRERERRARLRRQQETEQRRTAPAGLKGGNENQPVSSGKAAAAEAKTLIDIQSLWHKIRGPQQATSGKERASA